MSIDRLLRESNPPAGMLASPVPQYEDVSTGEPGAVKGRDGAPFSMLLGPDGQPIDPSNPLEVRVRELETELQELRQLLQSGDTKVQLSGQIAQVSASKSASRFGALAASTEEVLAEVQREAIIHGVLIKYDRDDPGARVFMDLWDGTQFQPLLMSHSPSSHTGRITPSDVLYNGLFEVLVNNHPDYVVRLREPMRVAGFRLRVSNILQENIQIATSVVWSEV